MRVRAHLGTIQKYVAAAIFVGSISSCSGGTYEVRLQVQPRSLLDDAALIEVGVVPNCEATPVVGLINGDPLLRYEPGESPPALGEVPSGMHGLVARLVDRECQVIAFGCRSIDLTEGGSGLWTVPLTASIGDACGDATTCDAGRCEAQRPDAGPMPDGMTPDTTGGLDGGGDAMDDAGPVPDVGPDAGPDAGCDCPGGTCRGGVCCTGCWQGGTCRAGLATDECGMGGAECDACACPTPSCHEGACGVQPFRSVDMGSSHACFVTHGNALYCAGRNNAAQLGGGTMSVRETTPQRVLGNWESVAVGAQHSCGIQVGGGLYCWGQSDRGQAGQNGGVVMTPSLAMPDEYDALRINSALNNTFVRRTDGVWFGFGANDGRAIDPEMGGAVRVPGPILTVDGDWRDISAGLSHTCGVTNGGAIYCWGDNDRGQFGTANMADNGPRLVAPNGWDAVVAGFDVTCALRDGLIRCSGYNNNRVLGRTTGGAFDTSFEDTDPTGIDPVSITGDHSQICAIDAAGMAVCWGSNQHGQLGFGHRDFVPRPIRVPHFDDTYFDLARGAGFGFFDGENRVWGVNEFDPGAAYIGQGRLGLGHTDNVVQPTPLCLED